MPGLELLDYGQNFFHCLSRQEQRCKQGELQRRLTKQDWYLEKLLFHQHCVFKSKWSKLCMVDVFISGRNSMENTKDTQDFRRTWEDPRQTTPSDRCLHKVFQWNPLYQALGKESPAKQLELFFPNDTAYATQHLNFLSEETSPLKVTLPVTKGPSNAACHLEDSSCSSQTAPPKQHGPAIKPTLSTTQAFAHPHLPPQLAQRIYEGMQSHRTSVRLCEIHPECSVLFQQSQMETPQNYTVEMFKILWSEWQLWSRSRFILFWENHTKCWSTSTVTM